MKHFFFYLLSTLPLSGLLSQTTATFESFTIAPGGFLNGSDGNGGFSDGNIFLPNTFDSEFEFWSGWAISGGTDTLTPGFTNQYSAIAGSGYDDSDNYALSFASPTSVLALTGDAQGGMVEGLYVTNSTYAYLSMANGDAFAKQFGGESGSDPDFFLLTIKKYLNGMLGADSIDFYLADFRFEDNTQDYLVKEWTYIDLTPLGNADSLQFVLSSSDVGQFGINTPTYFCIDQVTTLDRPSGLKNYRPDLDINFFPNPTTDRVSADWTGSGQAEVFLYDIHGQALLHRSLQHGHNEILMGHRPNGQYLLKIKAGHVWSSRVIIKQ